MSDTYTGGSEAFAIIGYACRLPGAPGPAPLWDLLATGTDAITETPSDRVRVPGATRGGFIEHPADFDAGFFGISPREAAATDPQQRLALELAWEALEDARHIPADLSGSSTGVFLGAIWDDYAALLHREGDTGIDRHSMPGLQRGLIANRLSYTLKLHGPSLTVDAGQSSSLVSVHLACESLARGESELALAGGVNLILAPDSTVSALRFGGLSPDGRCFTFDERANGFVRGEGGAVVVLKPLARALADGDRIHAVIHGSAINNDGGGPSLTAPSATAQEAVLRAAHARAGVAPDAVGYVELHGTGTPVGDPVEAAALGAVLGAERTEPLPVGSVKTNIGHLEGAAGIAGLLKATLAVERNVVPPSLNFRSAPAGIPLERLNLRIQTEATPLGGGGFVGVSSFGMGGTNCHLVLGPAPDPAPHPATKPPAVGGSTLPVPVLISGHTAQALRSQAARLKDAVESADLAVADVAHSLATTRTRFARRAVLLAENQEQLLTQLDAVAAGLPAPGTSEGTARTGRLAMVFSGQGSQWPAMAAELLDTDEVFTRTVHACAEALAPHTDFSLTDVLHGAEGAPTLERVDVVQPALFAVMVALAETWRSLGVVPDAVTGHSQGEIAAACVAGALSLEDAAKVVALRSRAIGALAGQGGMLSVQAGAAQVRPWLDDTPALSIAADNGPTAVVVSGPDDALDDFAARCTSHGVDTKRIPVDYASHSAHVEQIRDELLTALADIEPRTSELPFLSTVTGEWMDTAGLDAAYWYRNLRSTVEFAAAVRRLADEDFRFIVEATPHPVLVAAVRDTLAELDVPETTVVGSLRRGEGGRQRLLASAAELLAHGRDVRLPAPPGAVVDLPTYAFQRERHWRPGAGAAQWNGSAGPVRDAAPDTGADPDTAAAPDNSLRDRLRALSPQTARSTVGELVRSHAAVVGGFAAAGDVDPELPFKALGIASLTLVELRDRLAAATGLALPPTFLFDHPTPAAAARRLCDALRGEDTAAPSRTTASPACADGDDPVVIVAMACRFPGGIDSPAALWEALSEGREVLTGLPEDRGWQPSLAALDTPLPTAGGFLDDIAGFDAALFGISPREAAAMDPQQRLLLEVTWEALERLGTEPADLRGSRTGVFVGATAQDYGPRMYEPAESSEGYLLTGTTASVASGRIAYAFEFDGPAVTVDTACSSSLVALHLAAQSLRAGECSMALAGGVTLMATPGVLVEFARQDGLSPDGRCKAFGAQADGTGWSEGVGVLVLRRLSDALADGQHVLAVLRGSAVNSDGASNGLTAPNGLAQQRVIRAALETAGLEPHEVDLVEAHGTGTRLGDPIEAQALLATYGQDRDADRPLWLGSLKSNIGHTQAAAGVAGVIKTVMALRHGVLPRTLHADEPTPHVDWSAGAVQLLTENVTLPPTDRPYRAGVSSFGISGTNAHAVIEAAPEPAAPDEESTQPALTLPVLLSGHGAAALRDQAARLRVFLDAEPSVPLTAIARSSAITRFPLDHRTAVFATDREELAARLDAVTAGHDAAGVLHGVAAPGRTGFLFSGQGSQRPGMGRELYEAFGVFADAFDAVCARVDVGRPLGGVVFGEDAGLLERTVFAQAGLFAVEVALFRLVESWGVVPDVLVGHSVGELAAAHCAGVLSLDDACVLVSARGRLMDALPAGGAMLAVGLAEEALVLPDGVDLAAVNGPASVTVSGDAEAVAGLEERLRGDGVRVKRLAVSHAFHSRLMEPMLAEFTTVAESLTYHAPQIPVRTTAPGAIDTPAYWVGQIREPVRFADAVRRAHEAGATRFLELGPDGALSALVPHLTEDTTAAPALRPGHDEHTTLLRGIAEMYVHGADVAWEKHFAPLGGHAVELPTYAFQHQRYWPDTVADDGFTTPRERTEAGFWTAVAGREVDRLADTLGLPDDETRRGLADLMPHLASWHDRRSTEAAVESWYHRAVWRPVAPAPAVLDGVWLVVGPDSPAGLDTQVADALRRSGATVLALPDPGADRTALADQLRSCGELTGVVSLLGTDTGALHTGAALGRGLAATLSLTQACAEADVPLWALTRGAVSTGRADGAPDPAQAQIWGFGRGAALELPHVWGGLIDLPENLDARAGNRLCAVLAAGDTHPGSEEDQVAIRAEGVFARRLAAAPPIPPAAALTPRTSGTVLVTGGTGALGAQVARLLAAQGHTRLLLVSRRGPEAPGAAELAAELASMGTTATAVACDVADHDALAALLAEIPEQHRLTAVVHAAGVLDDGVLDGLTPERFEHVLRAKTLAAENLDALTRALPLDAFVLFSSFTGAVGTAGQANYAAANAHLDALAERRRAQGLPATSIGWGPWAETGMAEDEALTQRLRRSGLTPLPPDLAVTVLSRMLGGAVTDDDGTAEAAVVVADVDWTRFAAGFTAARPSPLLRELVPAGTPDSADDSDGATGLAARLAAAGEGERRRISEELVRTLAAFVLGHGTAATVAPDKAFRDLGFDSLTAIELRNALRAATGLPLPAGLIFDHPTPAALAARLRAELTGGAEAAASATVTPGLPASPAPDDPVAIVALGCRFPGAATPEEFWDLLSQGLDMVGDFPADRGWDLRDAPDFARRGGFLPDAAGFDADLFGVSPREAQAMDPQQRLMLETSWETFERAGLDPASLQGSRVGVFVGTNGQDYAGLFPATGSGLEGHVATGSAASVLSGRISYTYGLEGPAVTVDTACSSSLVALHLAAQSLRSGECSMALAGGVTVMAAPTAFLEFAHQRGLAADGRCKAFAASADGTGWGEGAGLVLLERLSDARANGRRVLGLLRGSAVNQDGASNGLTAPNGPAQQRVIRAALASAGLWPSEVDAVEAHGTGTKLGDPIEAEALLATYGKDRSEPLYLGSVKSNIGHTQAAAGVAGVIKMLLAMQHGELPRTLHAAEPSPSVDWDTGSLKLLTETTAWTPRVDRPRRAAVSSFGISGTNAHVVLEQTDAVLPAAPAQHSVLPWAFSAHSDAALHARAKGLMTLCEDPGVSAVATGRALATTGLGLAHRAVVLAEDATGYTDGLTALTRDEPSATTIRGTAREGSTALLFSGQGSQRPGMGRELYEAFPVFADAFDAVCARVDVGRPLGGVVFGEDAGLLGRTVFAQAGLFAVEVALFRLVESWGVVPDVLVGHSVGELAAAHCAGVLSLDDACVLVSARGRLMEALPAGGAMLAVELAEEALVLPDGVDLAAVNGPASVTVSGDAEAVAGLEERLRGDGVRVKRLAVSHAFHSRLMEPMLAEFTAVAESLTYHPPQIPVLTTAPGDLATPGYWVGQIREPVRFADAVRRAHEAGATRFLELGPDGALSGLVPGAVPAMRRRRPEAESLFAAVARLWVEGTAVNLAAVFPEAPPVTLPPYPFQHTRFWPEAAPPRHPTASGEGQYDVRWVPVTEEAARSTGLWILVTPPGEDDSADDVSRALHRVGVRTLVIPGSTDRAALAARLRAAAAETTPAGVLALPPAPGSDALPPVVALTQALDDAGVTGPLWCATRGAVRVSTNDPGPDPVQAAVWGFGRVAALEMPRSWGGLVDLPADWDDRAGIRLAALLGADGPEDQVAIRRTGVLGRRLVTSTPGNGNRTANEWRPTGTVLITGGTGALGAHTARLLARQGAPHLVLVGRRGPEAPGTGDLAAELTSLGSRVTLAACDVTDRAALTGVLAGIPEELPLTAVVHAAGTVEDGVISSLTPDRVADVVHARLAAARHLDELTAGHELDAFVLYTSFAGVVGNLGQAAYAAGNAALDAFAERRRAAGRTATALAWGPWAGAGVGAGAAAGEQQQRTGVTPLQPEEALLSLEAAIAEQRTTVCVAGIDWSRFGPVLEAGRGGRLLNLLPSAPRPAPPVPDRQGPGLAEQLAGVPQAQQERILVDLVVSRTAAVLGHSTPAAIDPDRHFRDLGTDSVMAVELRNLLDVATGQALPATLAFDHPTPTALAAYLRVLLVSGQGPATVAGAESTVAHLEKLEAALAETPPDSEETAVLLARLRDLTDRLGAAATVPPARSRPQNEVIDLESASADDLFDLIHNEFGKS
ncbi:SDR family NAD(P)-dependent oxidoreductase [Streptomyces sp. WA6-1-16]|uniref:type I polyketide synthase n=1 Tax=Streptomyces sp. WA6-1-16 TaxID=2879427 RepID=UPI001CE33788|nr:type I polyketide synthase [Streptomyces sp. WA6-1-16]UCA51130.1 SDR family NAD(P)-dependent oxidoreductase [Streptomyces sp. WA6-1-16]